MDSEILKQYNYCHSCNSYYINNFKNGVLLKAEFILKEEVKIGESVLEGICSICYIPVMTNCHKPLGKELADKIVKDLVNQTFGSKSS